MESWLVPLKSSMVNWMYLSSDVVFAFPNYFKQLLNLICIQYGSYDSSTTQEEAHAQETAAKAEI